MVTLNLVQSLMKPPKICPDLSEDFSAIHAKFHIRAKPRASPFHESINALGPSLIFVLKILRLASIISTI